MRTIYTLATISAILFIFCLIGGITLIFLPDGSGTTVGAPPPNQVISPILSVILPETADAGQEYQDSLYFIGDSTTYHFFKGGIDKSHLLVPDSLTLQLSASVLEELDLEVLAHENAKIVIITVGVNGSDLFTESRYKTYYKKLIRGIREVSPETEIILQSVFPVTKEYSDDHEGVITNAGIDRLNEWAKEIALDEGLRYLDSCSVLKDLNGAQLEDYGEGDGVHMNAQAYEAILTYIRTHALETDN